jgi:hypothetical protein
MVFGRIILHGDTLWPPVVVLPVEVVCGVAVTAVGTVGGVVVVVVMVGWSVGAVREPPLPGRTSVQMYQFCERSESGKICRFATVGLLAVQDRTCTG